MTIALLAGACGADDPSTKSDTDTDADTDTDTDADTDTDTDADTDTDTDADTDTDTSGATETSGTTGGSGGGTATTGDTSDTGTEPGELSFLIFGGDVDGGFTVAPLEDSDGNGIDELLVANSDGYLWRVEPPAKGNLSLWARDAVVTDAAGATLPPHSTGDVDGDGSVDVFVTTTSAVHLLTTIPAKATAIDAVATATLALPRAEVAVADDLDGDGLHDVLVHDDDDGRVLWFEAPFSGLLDASDAEATWSGTKHPMHTSATAAITPVPDLTGDGRPDVLVGAAAVDRAWLLGSPVPGMASLDDVAVATYVSENIGSAMGSGDVDGDGTPDVVFGQTFASEPHPVKSSWYVSDAVASPVDVLATAHTAVHQDDPDIGHCTTTLVADMDADGADDLVMSCPYGYDRSDVFVVHGPIARGTVTLPAGSTGGHSEVGYPYDIVGTWMSTSDLDHDGDRELLYSVHFDYSYGGFGKPGPAGLMVSERI